MHKRDLILRNVYLYCYDQKLYLFKGVVEKKQYVLL